MPHNSYCEGDFISRASTRLASYKPTAVFPDGRQVGTMKNFSRNSLRLFEQRPVDTGVIVDKHGKCRTALHGNRRNRQQDNSYNQCYKIPKHGLFLLPTSRTFGSTAEYLKTGWITPQENLGNE